MTRLKKLAIGLAVLLVPGYFSKPDHGGIDRCARIFELQEPRQFQLSPRPFFAWDLFESPKFRFRITPSGFSRLKSELKAAGYSEWTRGFVTFGSLSVGDSPEDDHIYCSLKRGGHGYHWSYSAKESIIYAIKFP